MSVYIPPKKRETNELSIKNRVLRMNDVYEHVRTSCAITLCACLTLVLMACRSFAVKANTTEHIDGIFSSSLIYNFLKRAE